MARLDELLNTEEALRYCINDENFFPEILREYINGNRLNIINDDFSKSDMDNYRIQVHALKSNSKSIGADDLSEQARLLEEAAKNADTDYIAAHHEEAVKQYSELLEKLRVILG